MSALELALSDRLREIDLDVELEVGPASCVALAGPSGAGKTTVLRTVAGLHRPTRGVVSVDGERWLDTEAGIDVEPERRRCGFLFQEFALFPHLTAQRNVAFGIRGVPPAERRRRALAMLERFGVERVANARPGSLSGGERQRVALARALAPQPRVLLLDEPLAALDARTRARAGRELALALRDVGVPAILVTHDFGDAALLGDGVCVMDRGHVVQRGPAGELSARPASSFVADFAGAVVLAGRAMPEPGGLTRVELEGGGAVRSTDHADGPVAVSMFPWEISIELPGKARPGSALNRVAAEITSLTTVGNRVRVGLAAPQTMVAEVTTESVEGLDLRRGGLVNAVWKATATRLVPR
jgi:molybdate transport system ATP-binding protein